MVKNQANEIPDFSYISKALGGDRKQFHPDELLSDPEFPLEYLNPAPLDRYDEWDRPDLRDFTHAIGAAWEESLADRYNMELVRKGPIDLRVTEGPFRGSPVEAKSACIINSRDTREDGSVISSPGQIYVKKDKMRRLVNLDFDDIHGLETEDYSSPAILHASVHYPKENMPNLPENFPFSIIESPGERNYQLPTAYVGEIVLPAKPLFRENQNAFNGGKRGAWPLEWKTAFGKNEEEENFMRYWRDERLESPL